MLDNHVLSPDLEEWRLRMRSEAVDFGLDFFEVIFEMVDYDEMNMVAAYGGFPTRYPHWRFGMQFEELQKQYSYGLAKIYELVINNDPCYAYLMRCNPLVDQKLVMAHVYGHSDFFKNNYWFSKTNRKMVDAMANHAVRVRRYIDTYGKDEVEEFIDVCLSLENLIDIHSSYFGRRTVQDEETIEEKRLAAQGTRFPTKPFMEAFVNPPEVLDLERNEIIAKLDRSEKFPTEPEADVLSFLLHNAPLRKWQRDIISIIRKEAYYFAPQGMTKIMNEGWASYWHSKIMTTRALDASEIIDYADHHSGTLGTRPGVGNPYKVGIELFRDIEDRWNKGCFGREYEDCTDLLAKRTWDRKLGLGREKIFEVRKIYNDVTFIDEFLTQEFCENNNLFTYRFDRQQSQYVIESREFQKIKAQFLDSLSNLGRPQIRIDDGNFKNRSELHLTHEYSGTPLRFDFAQATLENLYKIWTRPVHLESQIDGKRKLISYNGTRHDEKTLG